MRDLRPEYYSDTQERKSYELEAEVFDHFLGSLTSRNEHHDFEIFCRKLCERTIAPNLRPATGPEGGGDGKADTETTPVAEEVSDMWYVGEPNVGKEKWGFAFSAKAAWAAKVRSDVKGLIETGRNYDRIICVTSQYAKSKDCLELEQKLSAEYRVPVTIHDRAWIIDEVIAKDKVDIAFNYLRVGREIDDAQRLGPVDYSRTHQLDGLEASLRDPANYAGMERQMVIEALLAAKLSRGLGKDRTETDGRFTRAIRLADKHGSFRKKLETRYEHLWTAFWWFDDVELLNDSFDQFADMALTSDNAMDVEFSSNLLQNLFNSVLHGLLSRDQAKLDERSARVREQLKQIAGNAERPNNALEARALLVLHRLNLAWIDTDLPAIAVTWPEFSDVLAEARKLAEFDIQRLVRLVEVVGQCAGDDPSYDALVDQMADLVSLRRSEGEGAILRLNRALQLPPERNLDIIRMLGRAGHELVKREYAESFISAMQHLAISYQSAGLLWAARATTLLAAAHIAIEGERDGDIDVSLIPTLKVLCWQSLQLRHYPDLLLAYQTLGGALKTLPLTDQSKELVAKNLRELDIATASTLLNLSNEELVQVEHLPDVLAGLDMGMSRLALLYALGYENELRTDGSLPEKETPQDVASFMSILASQPVSDDLRASFIGHRVGLQTLKTIVLGMEIVVHFDGSDASTQVAELVLAAIETCFATTIDMQLLPHAESYHLYIEETDGVVEPAFDVDPTRVVTTLKWPKGVAPGTFDETLDVPRYLLQVAFTTILSTCLSPNFEETFDTLANKEGCLDRISLTFASSNSYHRFFGFSVGRLSAWDEFKPSAYPAKAERPSIPHVDLPGEDDEPNDGEAPARLNHRKVETHSVIDHYLWNSVGWNGALYGTSAPGQPPLFGLIFSQESPARRIFERWRERFGTDDTEDQIYISIVTDIDAAHPLDYEIFITSRPRPNHKTARSGGTNFLTQHHRMSPTSLDNLNRFKEAYDVAGAYVLVPVTMQSSGEPKLHYDLPIGKHVLRVVSLNDVREGDLEFAFLEQLKKRRRDSEGPS
jgi:hypothetical protein